MRAVSRRRSTCSSACTPTIARGCERVAEQLASHRQRDRERAGERAVAALAARGRGAAAPRRARRARASNARRRTGRRGGRPRVRRRRRGDRADWSAKRTASQAASPSCRRCSTRRRRRTPVARAGAIEPVAAEPAPLRRRGAASAEPASAESSRGRAGASRRGACAPSSSRRSRPSPRRRRWTRRSARTTGTSAPRRRRGRSFDELAFLSSIVGEGRRRQQRACAGAVPKVRSSSVGARAAAVARRRELRRKSVRTDSLLAGLENAKLATGERPLAANVSANMPIVLRTSAIDRAGQDAQVQRVRRDELPDGVVLRAVRGGAGGAVDATGATARADNKKARQSRLAGLVAFEPAKSYALALLKRLL